MNMHITRIMGFVAVTVAAGLCISACDDVVKDATFRMWCGENLCAWTTEAGTIRRAPTWHKKDYGVELVDTPTVISQTVTDKSPRCLEFTTVADVEARAQVTIGVDFNADGVIDYEQPIAETGFRESRTLVTAPVRYQGIRFVIAKKGIGRAVLAQIRVQSAASCTGPEVELSDLPIGFPCAPLAGGAECRSGVCCEGLCSECCGADAGATGAVAAACSDGGLCARRDVANVGPPPLLLPTVPHQCDPGTGARSTGEACLSGDDCTSGACEGSSFVAIRADDDGGVVSCDATFPDAGESCVYTSARGGRCR
jgi:hypothetical protein